MSATATLDNAASLISALGLDDSFQPQEPSTLSDTGLSEALIEDFILKYLSGIGSDSGRSISDNLCLPMAILEDRFFALRQRQEIAPSGAAMLGDHVYRLTDVGKDRALRALRECAYVGPAPVLLEDYVSSVHAQTISSERPRKPQLEKAFSDIHVEPKMLSQLGPAINAGKGMFIYGPPGNGKTTIAQRITRCFGQNILIPHAIVEGGKIIKMYDASCHKAVRSGSESLLRTAEFDRRWIRIERPTVVVGGELTMDSLELKHDPVSNVSEASLQLKSNCGCLLIDDFGRQRINPTELLNRWIIPLENRIDYLSLSNGRKIEVPFEQLIIFSTNLEPHDLADDAFLRRIPFKVEIGDPSTEEFHLLFQVFAKKHRLECPREMVDYLIRTHYQACSRPLRRCQARDLLEQVVYYCSYNELPLELKEEYLDHAVQNYFTALKGD
jgi:predicted ATPase with chaperone activity